MSPAFWDTSALVPLCVSQQPEPAVKLLLQEHDIVVWWATPVEMRSAFERLLRMSQLTDVEHGSAGARLQKLRLGWREIQPSTSIQSKAEFFLHAYPLRAADALQLAAAWTWCSGAPQTCIFISGDRRLIEAAIDAGFQALTT